MSIYLVDYASIRGKAFDETKQISSQDTIYIYYNVFSSKLSFETLDSLRNSGALVKTVNMGFRLFTHPLAVKLAATLGYLLGCGSAEKVYIVSKRKSLTGLLDFAKEYGLGTNVYMAESIGGCINTSDRRANVSDKRTSYDTNDLSIPAFLRGKPTPSNNTASNNAQTKATAANATATQTTVSNSTAANRAAVASTAAKTTVSDGTAANRTVVTNTAAKTTGSDGTASATVK